MWFYRFVWLYSYVSIQTVQCAGGCFLGFSRSKIVAGNVVARRLETSLKRKLSFSVFGSSQMCPLKILSSSRCRLKWTSCLHTKKKYRILHCLYEDGVTCDRSCLFKELVIIVPLCTSFLRLVV